MVAGRAGLVHTGVAVHTAVEQEEAAHTVAALEVVACRMAVALEVVAFRIHSLAVDQVDCRNPQSSPVGFLTRPSLHSQELSSSQVSFLLLLHQMSWLLTQPMSCLQPRLPPVAMQTIFGIVLER